MLVAPHAGGHVAVTQAAHAWVSGQLARVWGGEAFPSPEPLEEVCLAAEQHDVGMTAWDRRPALDPATGLPTTFMQMDLDTHLRLWTEGPASLVGQSRYAALLASMHGSALYARRDLDAMAPDQRDRVSSFLAERRRFEQELRATLRAGDEEVARNQRLVWTWDGMSLALILGWAPWTAGEVPAAGRQRRQLRLEAPGRDGVHRLDPWPFAADAVTVRTQGRLLPERCPDAAALQKALEMAPWVDIEYRLAPGVQSGHPATASDAR